METRILGTSVSGLPIVAHFQERGLPRVLVLGGVHGDEHEGVWTAMALVQRVIERPVNTTSLMIAPAFNIDGVLAKTRGNQNGIDLNRNLPTQDWTDQWENPRYKPGPSPASEPENRALISCIDQFSPHYIISLHSWKPLLNINGDSRPEAEAMAKILHYPIEETIGYPTPGSLGTYGAKDRGIPVLTVELERGSPKTRVPHFVDAVCAALISIAQRAPKDFS